MKKLFLPIIAAVLLFSGCQERSRVMTSYYKVDSNDWSVLSTMNADSTYTVQYVYSSWENYDITPEVIEGGVVLVYYIDEDGRDNILPYTLYYLDENGVPYQERFEYDIEPGIITFKFKDTDFQTLESLANIGTKYFKVSVIL